MNITELFVAFLIMVICITLVIGITVLMCKLGIVSMCFVIGGLL
jgi:hypothetical protein